MTAIAYITDTKMLENHRILRNNTMNFWRLSTNINFSDFKIGDLVFFLSKDKIHRRHGEKGIIGFGRLKELRVYSPNTMWKKYGKNNGYINKKEFEGAIRKVSKDNKLPSKISSMYLTNVVFFQNPTYLSEYNMQISKQVESYIYLNDVSIPFRILEYAKTAIDSWTIDEDSIKLCEEEQIHLYLRYLEKEIASLTLSEKVKANIRRNLKQYQVEHPEYEMRDKDELKLYKVNENKLSIVFYHDKAIDERLIIGQAYLYRYYLTNNYPYDIEISFKILGDEKLSSILNG